MSRVQVLVATMNQKDFSLIEKMHVKTDAIVGNQCDYNKTEEFSENGNVIKWLSFNERGVGLNRNNALMRASGEFLLFADDDMVYVDNYDKIVEEAFDTHKKADVIVFNLEEPVITRHVIKKKGKVGRLNYLRYGTARIAVRRDKIIGNGIFFNLCFGGGTQHCHGEDNIFLTDCLNKKLKIIALPIVIAKLTEERKSTWNNGYDEKYLKDQGALYKTISRRWWKFLCLQDALRHRKCYGMGAIKAYKLMVKGK